MANFNFEIEGTVQTLHRKYGIRTAGIDTGLVGGKLAIVRIPDDTVLFLGDEVTITVAGPETSAELYGEPDEDRDQLAASGLNDTDYVAALEGAGEEEGA